MGKAGKREKSFASDPGMMLSSERRASADGSPL